MRKLTHMLILVLATIVFITFNQCRKGVEPDYVMHHNDGEKITLTLNASNGDSGTRTEITQSENSSSLNVVWSDNDIIYVAGSLSGYLGTLTLQSGANTKNASFTGGINTYPTQDLHLYYLGKNGGAVRTITENAVSIGLGSQAGTLDDIENYHIATATLSNVEGNTRIVNADFSSAISILKFDMSDFSNANHVTLYGSNVYKNININLQSGAIEGTNEATLSSPITLGLGGGIQYAALLPATVSMTLSDGTTTNIYNDKVLSANTFYSDGGAGLTPLPAGALSGIFTVNIDGATPRRVRFSQGNLQYLASPATWRFAPNQYDYIGNAAGNTTAAENRATQTEWIDLFGWGTSGYRDTRDGNTYQTIWMPYEVSTNELASTDPGYEYNATGYGPDYNLTDGFVNLSVTYQSDWGYNTITGAEGSWRTLTREEWDFLMDEEEIDIKGGDPSHGRNNNRLFGNGQTHDNFLSFKCKLSVDGNIIKGLMILPDNNTANVQSTNYNRIDYSDSSIPVFTSIPQGALFLPAAGKRQSTTVQDAGLGGYYHSATSRKDGNIFNFYYHFGTFSPYIRDSDPDISGFNTVRKIGMSVRLVQDIE